MTLTAKQLATRADGVGSSDCAAACGLSPYKSRYELWLEKTGRQSPPDLDEVERVQWGNILEPIIADQYAEREGVKLRRVNITQVHKDLPFMMSHVDRMVVGQRRALECKNASEYYGAAEFGEEYTDDVPGPYFVQVTHQMVVNGIEMADLAALIGGNKLRVFRFHLDDEIAELVVKKCTEFWRFVEDDTPPPAQNLQDLEIMHAEDNGQIKTVDASVLTLWDQFHDLKSAHKLAEAELEETKTRLKFAIAESAGIKLDDPLTGPNAPGVEYAGKVLGTWKTQGRKTLDTAALKADHPDIFQKYQRETRYRVLRVPN